MARLLTDAETAAILAGLRLLQRTTEVPADIVDVFDCGGELMPLLPAQIDELCEALNCGEFDAPKASEPSQPQHPAPSKRSEVARLMACVEAGADAADALGKAVLLGQSDAATRAVRKLAAWSNDTLKVVDAIRAEHASAQPQPPGIRIGVTMDGGLVQSVFSPDDCAAVRLVVFDYDTDGAQEDAVSMVRQSDGSEEECCVVEWDIERAPWVEGEDPALSGGEEDDDEEDEPNPDADRFLNHYACPCGATWTDPSPCQTDDDCPKCRTTCSPTFSEDL